MSLTVVIPTYNEEQNIKGLIEEVRSCVSTDTEIIVVDDASEDATSSVARACGVRVVSHPYNMGNGAAVKTGLRLASGERVLLMDGDGQHNPEDIPVLLEESEHFDMVIGARTPASAQVWYRKIANRIYNVLASYVAGMRIDDLTSGFRVIRRSQALKFLYLLPNTFSYPSTLTLSFAKAGYPIRFVPVTVLSRKKGKSKINLLSDGGRFFLIIIRIATFFAPLKVFLPTSCLFFLTGLFYYLYTFIKYHRFTNMSALLFTTSVIIFMLGLVSEQIANLRMEKTQ